MRKLILRPAAVAALCAAAAAGAFLTTAHAQLRNPDPARTKSANELRSVFSGITTKASLSTVRLKTEDKNGVKSIALGTIVSADGYILTKASDVLAAAGNGKVWVAMPSTSGGLERRYDIKVVGLSQPQDLAMVKIDLGGLTPIEFADTRPPPDVTATQPGGRGRGGRGRGGGGGGGFGGRGGNAPVVIPVPTTAPAPPEGAIPVDVGEWVASVEPGAALNSKTGEREPFAVGVISVARRRIAGRSAFLGVEMAETPDAKGVKVMQVVAGSGAEKAGLKLDDVIAAIDNTPVPTTVEMRNVLRGKNPGDVVNLKIMRGTQELSMRAELGVNTEGASLVQMVLAGEVSRRSSDFPAVFQHDTVIAPSNCGGPIVDLAGRVLGINIARAGRTETYAIPADMILPLIEPMKNGKLAPVNANVPSTRPGATSRPLEEAATMPADE